MSPVVPPIDSGRNIRIAAMKVTLLDYACKLIVRMQAVALEDLNHALDGKPMDSVKVDVAPLLLVLDEYREVLADIENGGNGDRQEQEEGDEPG